MLNLFYTDLASIIKIRMDLERAFFSRATQSTEPRFKASFERRRVEAASYCTHLKPRIEASSQCWESFSTGSLWCREFVTFSTGPLWRGLCWPAATVSSLSLLDLRPPLQEEIWPTAPSGDPLHPRAHVDLTADLTGLTADIHDLRGARVDLTADCGDVTAPACWSCLPCLPLCL